MKILDSYLDEYVDKHMESLIEEWQLATKRDVSTFTKRLQALEQEAASLHEFGTSASRRLGEMEERLKKIKEVLQ